MQEWPEGFDLAALLAPISSEAPAGSDLREEGSPDGLYFRLRDARREAGAAERAAEAPRDPAEPQPVDAAPVSSLAQWRIVRELAVEALAGQSKDLEIAAWLTEALLRSDGLLGLTAGSRLMTGLAEGFWDELFPQPDDEGIATRVAAVAALNGVGRDGTLIQPLRKLVLFERPTNGMPFCFYHYEQSADIAGVSDPGVRQERLDRGVLSFDVVETEAQTETARASLGALRKQVSAAAEAWQSLGRALDERAGADGPPTGRVLDLLEKVRVIADRFAGPETAALEEAAPPVAKETAATLAPASTPAVGGLASREDALRALAQIAEFFRRTEPLSPISYTLQEAVRRSRMTWPELLEEVVPDQTSRSAILSSLGIRPPPNE
jgi:type VI secretion system protein ImpA